MTVCRCWNRSPARRTRSTEAATAAGPVTARPGRPARGRPCAAPGSSCRWLAHPRIRRERPGDALVADGTARHGRAGREPGVQLHRPAPRTTTPSRRSSRHALIASREHGGCPRWNRRSPLAPSPRWDERWAGTAGDPHLGGLRIPGLSASCLGEHLPAGSLNPQASLVHPGVHQCALMRWKAGGVPVRGGCSSSGHEPPACAEVAR
jgi:hypothetical protein